MVFDSVAEYSLTGTFTIPNVIVPFQIDLGISKSLPRPLGKDTGPGRAELGAAARATL